MDQGLHTSSRSVTATKTTKESARQRRVFRWQKQSVKGPKQSARKKDQFKARVIDVSRPHYYFY